MAKNAGKNKLFEINEVWITKTELARILELRNKDLEKLAFTLLCLAKLNNIKNPKNNNWVNLNAKEIFQLARINCNISERYAKLGRLKELSLIKFPKKNDNLSSQVQFINDKSEKVLSVKDFRELGYEYLAFKGENFTRCQECGRLVKNNKYKNRKYCTDCAVYTPQKYKTIICRDCGKKFEVKGNNKRTIRCNECQEKAIKEYDRNRKKGM